MAILVNLASHDFDAIKEIQYFSLECPSILENITLKPIGSKWKDVLKGSWYMSAHAKFAIFSQKLVKSAVNVTSISCEMGIIFLT